MSKVLISDALSSKAAEVFRARGIDIDVNTNLQKEDLIARIGGYDGLAVRSSTKVTAEVLAAGKRLRVVGRAGIGVDNIDVAAATGYGIVVMNTPFGNSTTTAEHAIALLMALSRQIPQADRSTQMGKWEKSRFMGVEVTGKILGLIGCGNVGSIVAERAQGLKMRVLVYDPFMTNEHAADLGVERVELDILLARAHFISLHTPLTEATRGMIDAAALAKTQRGVRIINCARGGLILEGDLKEAIRAGHVAGAALDVFAEEPAIKNELFGMPEVIATPHLGAATNEAQEKVALQLAEQMSDYLANGSVTNALNMPSVSAEEAPRLAPYMALAYQLGSFAGQITETGIKEVAVEYEGAAAALNTRPLTATVLESMLSPLLESVNMVNAPLIAKERDIEVREIKRDGPCDYNSMIRLEVITETQTHSVAGTLFSQRPRLTHIAGINIEAELGPHMLFVTNQDKPGFIGSLGKTLGDVDLNIATFHLGRASPGAEAIALIEVDQPVTQELLDKVQALPYVVRANALYFAQRN